MQDVFYDREHPGDSKHRTVPIIAAIFRVDRGPPNVLPPDWDGSGWVTSTLPLHSHGG